MPSPRQSTRARRGWTDEHRAALLGHDWFKVFGVATGGMGPFTDRPGGVQYRIHEDHAERIHSRRQQAWNDLRDELMPIWIAEHPFERPPAWWDFDAPELRQCLTGIHPHKRQEFIEHCEQTELKYPGYTKRVSKTWFGVPSIAAVPGLPGTDKYESERAYLIRLDLLTNEERELLAQESTTPTGDAAPAAG